MPSRPNELASCLRSLCDTVGWDDYCRGHVEQAISALQKHLKSHADDGRAWELLGLALRDVGKPLHAADAFERASLLCTLQDLSRLCLTECYAVLKRHELAKDLYLLQAEALGDEPQWLLLIASGLDGIDQPQLSLELCRRAANLDPESGQVPFDMCFYAMRCGCPASMAESLAWRAVELEPDNVHFRIGLASLLVRLGDRDRDRACWVMRHLAAEEFQQVQCRCCLERIQELYQLAGDSQRANQCAQRLEQLPEPSRESAAPSENNG